jgi:hypothetical protein
MDVRVDILLFEVQLLIVLDRQFVLVQPVVLLAGNQRRDVLLELLLQSSEFLGVVRFVRGQHERRREKFRIQLENIQEIQFLRAVLHLIFCLLGELQFRHGERRKHGIDVRFDDDRNVGW